MYGIMHYCLAFDGCDILVLRRTYKELESGAIRDALNFTPKELFSYDTTRHVMKFLNGSRVVFAHCENLSERDISAFLGQAYSFCVVDECGQFSSDAWLRLYSRTIVNATCKPDAWGNLPIPAIVGCTNPIGPHYEFYRTLFVQKEPWNKPEDARKDELTGIWWRPEAGEWLPIYDPSKYAYQRTTVLDNKELLKRDPGILYKLNSLPKAKRDKELLGLDGRYEGAYFDCFDPYYHVINLREDPEAIIWQPSYQKVWCGHDFGAGAGGHASAAYLFTKALVRDSTGGDNYRIKTVCFREMVTTAGQTHKEWAAILANACKLPNGVPIKPSAIYFSHEKFARQMAGFGHTPADEYSRELKALGLPPVVRATTDRIGRASLLYNSFKNGDLVITDNCREIILAIPNLMRDVDNLDDVSKTDAKGDDCYDGFSYAHYGQYTAQKKPDVERIHEHAAGLDPLAKFFYLQKQLATQANKSATFKPSEIPVWQSKLNQQ
jgi:hypothetical protein